MQTHEPEVTGYGHATAHRVYTAIRARTGLRTVYLDTASDESRALYAVNLQPSRAQRIAGTAHVGATGE
jgi:hypothetical protein